MPEPNSGSGGGSGPLDPSHYIEHVTRTALLLESLARDVKSLKDQTERGLSNTDGLRSSLAQSDKDFAVYKVDTAAKISTNKECIEVLTERIKWLNRAVITTFLSGVIGGIIALIFRSLGD